MPERKVDFTSEPRVLAARIGRMRAYLKSAIDAGDWSIVVDTMRALQDEEAILADLTKSKGGAEGDAAQRLHNLERAFAAILAGMANQGGQRHPFYDAIAQDKPVRFTFMVGRDGKLTVNFVPVELVG